VRRPDVGKVGSRGRLGVLVSAPDEPRMSLNLARDEPRSQRDTLIDRVKNGQPRMTDLRPSSYRATRAEGGLVEVAVTIRPTCRRDAPQFSGESSPPTRRAPLLWVQTK